MQPFSSEGHILIYEQNFLFSIFYQFSCFFDLFNISETHPLFFQYAKVGLEHWEKLLAILGTTVGFERIKLLW